ncbi:carboxypeptidase-like regulatory domain-containing protein [Paludibaculum fermentans]|uniref:Carboxypeptidase regulatory-like domain-containing protein n=1 Tax=Paludibaculum fermentans TaxID=1473598 RepID=A0A7S7NWT4_PALFE|nr:carboxypeptidase-like regulatory domain-containing protein [Paludibaculum fermentans]QOY91247.1 carboxypeptidase regulatory-like domain-containing protein [Paludibaculum fermentans]
MIRFISNFAVLLPVVVCCGFLTSAEVVEISGRVVESGSGTPVANARVALFRVTPRSIQVPGGWMSQVPADDANPEGNVFLADTAVDGSFHFRVSSPALLLPLAYAKGFAISSDFTDRSKVVEIPGAGAAPSSLLLSLERESSLSGRVLDKETGDPLSGFAVTARLWAHGAGWGGRTVAAATTDSSGAYVLTGLRAGRYALLVRPPAKPAFTEPLDDQEFRDRVSTGYGRAIYPGVDDFALATPLDISPGSTLEKLDFRLRRSRRGALRGSISVPGDARGAAFELQLFEDQSTLSSLQFDPLARRPALGGERFLIEDLSPGAYTLCASTPQGGRTAPLMACVNLSMDHTTRETADLRPLPDVELQGALRFVEQPPPTQAKGYALLALRPVGRPSFWWDSPVSVPLGASPEGLFPVPPAMPGRYDVEVSGLPPSLAVAGIRWNGAAVTGRRITIDGAAPRQQLELVLTAALATLKVTLKEGRKSAGDWVLLVPDSTPPERILWESRSANADLDGRAVFAALPPGRYRLVALPNDGRPLRDYPMDDRLRAARVVELRPSETVQVEASPH